MIATSSMSNPVVAASSVCAVEDHVVRDEPPFAAASNNMKFGQRQMEAFRTSLSEMLSMKRRKLNGLIGEESGSCCDDPAAADATETTAACSEHTSSIMMVDSSHRRMKPHYTRLKHCLLAATGSFHEGDANDGNENDVDDDLLGFDGFYFSDDDEEDDEEEEGVGCSYCPPQQQQEPTTATTATKRRGMMARQISATTMASTGTASSRSMSGSFRCSSNNNNDLDVSCHEPRKSTACFDLDDVSHNASSRRFCFDLDEVSHSLSGSRRMDLCNDDDDDSCSAHTCTSFSCGGGD